MERGPALDPAVHARKNTEAKTLAPGLEFPRYFTLAGVDPFETALVY